jgi:hypothetical protein
MSLMWDLDRPENNGVFRVVDVVPEGRSEVINTITVTLPKSAN